MPSFDLLSQPWIPVLDAETDLRKAPDSPVVLREVGLREALLRAHELREIYSDSPLETIALNRLLLALSLDVYQPVPDEKTWSEVWRSGRLPLEPLDGYLESWGDRFDLLHEVYPFYQRSTPDAGQEGRDPITLTNLFHERASGNNATLFGHDIDAQPKTMSLSRAARGIVVTQSGGLGGGASKPFYFSNAPLIGRAQFWVRGRSLFEALLLNGPPTRAVRMGAADVDTPAWRREPSRDYRRRSHAGLLDVLTWPSRRLTLVAQAVGQDVVGTGVFVTQGDKLDPDPVDDPLSAYLTSEKRGAFALGLREGRSVWRDSSILFNTYNPDGSGAPETFRWIVKHFDRVTNRYDLRDVLRECGCDAFGLVNDKAKAVLWRHEHLPLHIELLRDPERFRYVKEALIQADKIVNNKKYGLRRSVRVTAEFLLSPPAPGDEAFPSADTNAVSALSKSLGAEPRYWTGLEPAFFEYLARVAEASREEEAELALAAWNRTTYEVALRAFDAATSAFDCDARHLRAQAHGRARLSGLEFDLNDEAPRPESLTELRELSPLSIFM